MRTLKIEFYKEIARIFREYGENGDRGMARRRLQMLKVNSGALTRRQLGLIEAVKRRLG